MKLRFLIIVLLPFLYLSAASGKYLNLNLHDGAKLNSPSKVNSRNTVMLSNDATYGKILTDGAGYSLYFFSKDTLSSSCTGQCAVIWPIFYADSLTIGAGLADSDFTTITRPDGSHQTAYKGWPLYYYSGDSKPGDVNGEDVLGIWFLAKPDYTIMLMNNQLVGLDSVAYNSMYQPGAGTVQYFVDAYGRTLYVFTHDTYNENHFTKPDFSNNGLWSIYEDSLQAVPPSINSKLFSMIDVYGRKQLTYKGWPLYEFGPDSMQRSNTRGVSFPSPGIWPVAVTALDSATITGVVSDNTGIPSGYFLYQNYPDPFNPTTVIQYAIPKAGHITLQVYDELGREVATLVNENKEAGQYRVNFNGSNLSSGIYFYRIQAGSYSAVKKLLLLK